MTKINCLFIFSASFLAAALLLSSCGNSPKQEEHHHDEDEHTEAGTIHVSTERQAEFGIKTDTVRLSEFHGVIKTTGEILPSTGEEMTISAPSQGILTLSGALSEGSKVAKGSPIGVISTKNVSGGDAITKARLEYERAKKEYERDIQLRKDNIISESHLDESEATYEQAKNEYEALSAGGAAEGGVRLTSPMSGYVKELLATPGEYVETGQAVATVTESRRLRLKALLSERYYGALPEISGANFKTSYGDKAWSVKDLSGRLISYGRSTSEGNMIPVIFEFNNTGGIIPGSFAEVYLLTKGEAEAIAAPVSAITEDEGEHYVYVQTAPETFIRKRVTLGESDGRRYQILSGLSEGDNLVVEGAVDVKLSALSAVPSGHNHQH